ncbi:MAG TPA: ATP-binding protein, partial [Aggregatilineales bacterium]|nr:ATP-binding protein [Aggregatilineales bacterium]
LLRLIDDILDISKIEAGRVELVRRPFDLETFMANIENTIRRQAEAKNLTLTVSVDSNLPREIVGDKQRLEQIVLNLASNAVKFTEQGSVTISTRRSGEDEWEIVVEDTGIGIPPHAQEIIFEKFRQVDGTSRRAYGGTGLGLAITRELAMLMDGNVRVKSKPGEGSTFTVTLPLLTPEKEGRW